MKKALLIFLLFAKLFSVQAQTPEPYKYLGSYTQPAPNAAALGKYVDYPVSYYTGTPNIGIPLYDLQDGAARTSISLSYHASGIRVAELASWVGLGWALNAGGMITRTVKGGPDEGVWNPQASPRGYYLDSGIKKIPMLPYPVNGAIPINNTLNSSEIRKSFLTAISAGYADGEPDIFSFNVNGLMGKFVFDENRTPVLLSEQDVKIAVNFAGNDFTAWIITAPDGTKYYFGENNTREVNQVYTNGVSLDNNTLRPSSWLLTRIIYPNTKDTVYFDYTGEAYSYYDLGQETNVFGEPSGNPLQSACQFSSFDGPKTIYKTTVNGQRLTRIRSRNYIIAFSGNTSRLDLIGTSKVLDSVKIYNSQNQCIKQYLLTYDYFNSTTAANLPAVAPGIMNNDISDTKRLKLLSVKELSGDGLTSRPAYTFTYQESKQLPRRMSFDQDHWGYSNNASGNGNSRFTPHVYHSICINTNGPAANRDPKWPDMQAATIKSIKDPLGAMTNFDFEMHTSDYADPSKEIGGLRIKQISVTDSLTGKNNVRKFDYGNGGIVYQRPVYLLFPQNEYYYRAEAGVISWPLSYQGYSFTMMQYISSAIRQSQSIVPMQSFQGNHIGYSMVKEIFGQNGEGGYKIYSFLASKQYNTNSRLDISNYTALANVSTEWGNASGIYGSGHFNDIAPENLQYTPTYFANYLYPQAPEQVDFRLGQLSWEEIYDSSNTLIRSTRNTYTQNFHENRWTRGFKLYQSTWGGIPEYAMTYYKLRTGISHLTSATSIDYKDGKAFTTVTNFQYESPYHTQKTGDSTVNSSDDIIVNKTYYSFDYSNGATTDNVFGKLKARNMLLPVATRTWKNNQLISGTVTLYKDFATATTDTFINPSKIYALETGVPLTTAQAGENVAFTSAYTTLLPNTNFKEKASFTVSGTTAKIIEQKLVNDKNQALIWDNKLNMPLAQTDNALFADVAYNSFETTETGNWTYAAGSVVNDATAATGSKAYTISGGISKTGLTSAKKYILSYWLKNGGSATVSGGTQSNSISGRVLNGWTYKQVTITGTTSISISGSGSMDEVRLHPADAQMTTYTYDALMRLVAQNSANNSISYYEYDSMNRLVDIKDQYGNVLKAFEYNYGRSSRPGNP